MSDTHKLKDYMKWRKNVEIDYLIGTLTTENGPVTLKMFKFIYCNRSSTFIRTVEITKIYI